MRARPAGNAQGLERLSTRGQRAAQRETDQRAEQQKAGDAEVRENLDEIVCDSHAPAEGGQQVAGVLVRQHVKCPMRRPDNG